MPKNVAEKIMVAEQVLEVRYVPVGSFLDVRGYVADFIRESGFLPHWKIDTDVVNFRDKPDMSAKEGAFAGYRTAGYFAYDPETRNFFVDRGGAFWRLLQKNQHYAIPALQRFGARTKVFLPSAKSFEEINRAVYQVLYSEKVRGIVGGAEKDCQFIIESMDEGFDGRTAGGPIHNKEGRNYFSFDAKHFESAGFFLDVDFYRTKDVKHEEVPKLLRAAVDLTWKKIESFAAAIGV